MLESVEDLFRELNGVTGSGDLAVRKKSQNKGPDTHTEDGILIRKLYVGNLTKDVTDDDVSNLFKKFGQIDDIIIQKPKGKSFAYAFVTFSTNEGALNALKNCKRCIFSMKKLRVQPADSWHQPDLNIQNDDAEPASSQSVMVTDEQSREDDSFDPNLPSIDMLNDDCLLIIFGMLPLKKRIEIERVCKRWRDLCYVLWNNQRSLSFDSDTWGSWDFTFTTQCLRSLLIRCGSTLKKLDISEKIVKLNSRTLTVIGKYCPELEILNISGLCITIRGAQVFAKHCTKLRELYMEHCSGIKDSDIVPILKQNENLQVLNVARNTKLKGLFMEAVTKNIKHLNLMHCTSLEDDKWVKCLKKFKRLTILNLDSCVTLRNFSIRNIIDNVPQLENLTVSNFLPYVSSAGMSHISNLKNLVVLNLNLSSSVNDNTLKLISKECLKLEVLDITCSRDEGDLTKDDITDDGVGVLANLPNLQTLYTSYLTFGDTGLNSLSTARKLRKLQCRGCPSITDRGAKSVLEYCNQLTDFDVSGCELITHQTLDTAINVMTKRAMDNAASSLPLCLCVGGTQIVHDQLPTTMPAKLEVLFIDLSVRHLRPDYNDDIFSIYSDDSDVDVNSLLGDDSPWENDRDADIWNMLDGNSDDEMEFSDIENYLDGYDDYDDPDSDFDIFMRI